MKRTSLLYFLVLIGVACGCGDGEVGLITDSGTGSDATSDIGPPDTSNTPEDAGVSDAPDLGEVLDVGVVEEDVATEEPDVPVVEPGPQVQFMWPIDAWVAANHNYYNRGVHSGSADFAAPHGTPVFASRGGTVSSARWTELGGNTLVIQHGDGYSTLYSHLIEPALVEVGDVVDGGQLVGALGRTGNAFLNGAHLHFAIRRDGERLVIPSLDYGDWVRLGEPIPGSYGPLNTFEALRPRYEMEVLDDGVPAFNGASQGSGVVAELDAGSTVSVLGSGAGYYEVELADGQRGWVVHNAMTPEGVRVSGVRITATNANIRSGPSTSDSIVGTLPNGRLVTVFETRNSFRRLLFGLPTIYAWTHTSNTEPTVQHEARIRAWSANVRSSPAVGDNVIGSLSFTDRIIVLEQHHGWYRINFDGRNAWVAGWLTQGRL